MSRNKLLRHIGRRGGVLLILALFDIAYAFSLYRPIVGEKRSFSTSFLADILPLPIWGTLWLGIGLALLAGAFQRRDRWAYVLAVGLKVLWGLLNLLGWLLADVNRAWVAAIIWLAFAAMVFIISSWPEPPRDLFARES